MMSDGVMLNKKIILLLHSPILTSCVDDTAVPPTLYCSESIICSTYTPTIINTLLKAISYEERALNFPLSFCFLSQDNILGADILLDFSITF